jgi:hypothetical protein
VSRFRIKGAGNVFDGVCWTSLTTELRERLTDDPIENGVPDTVSDASSNKTP